MFFEAPPAIICEIHNPFPPDVFKAATEHQKDAISVMAFGTAKDLGVREDNTIIHFYHQISQTVNARIVDACHAGINQVSSSSWWLYYSGASSVTVEFNLSEEDLMRENLGLYLTHLSSDLHRGSYDSAITILINGQLLVPKYVPASHDWIYDDHFDLTSLVQQNVLQPGANTVQIRLHEDASSCYWLHRLKIQ